MSKELAKTDTPKGLMTPVRGNIANQVEASDIEIPKILLMQGLSELVAEQRASMGDFVDSITGEKLGSPKEPLRLVPVCFTKDYIITEKRGQKFEFKRFEDYTLDNTHLQQKDHWDFEEGGIQCRRALRRNIVFFLEKEAAEVGVLPHVMSFQVSSARSAKRILNLFTTAQVRGTKPWYFVVTLGAKLEKNDLGTFYVPTLVAANPNPAFGEVTENCQTWEGIFDKGSAKVDERDVADESGGGDVGAEERF